MRTTIDQAGRLVLPKPLRDQVGLVAGEVEVTLDGTGIRIEPVATTVLVERDGHLFLPDADSTEPTTADEIRDLRLADQR